MYAVIEHSSLSSSCASLFMDKYPPYLSSNNFQQHPNYNSSTYPLTNVNKHDKELIIRPQR